MRLGNSEAFLRDALTVRFNNFPILGNLTSTLWKLADNFIRKPLAVLLKVVFFCYDLNLFRANLNY